MVAIESTFEIPEQDEISLVSLRKYANELDLRWWERWYLYAIWLPVVRFGFKRMHIAGPSAMRPDGTIEFIEQVGAYADEATAMAAHRNNPQSRFSPDRYYAKPLPFGTPLPDESVQYKGHKASPGAVIPDRYRRRTFPVTVAPEHQMQEVKRNLEQTIKSLAAT